MRDSELSLLNMLRKYASQSDILKCFKSVLSNSFSGTIKIAKRKSSKGYEQKTEKKKRNKNGSKVTHVREIQIKIIQVQNFTMDQ